MYHFLANLWGSSFWQSVAGSILINTLSALGIGTALITFLKYGIGVVWVGRRMVLGWAALGLCALITLEAIRFNTSGYKQSSIGAIQVSLNQINQRLSQRKLTTHQRKCLIDVLHVPGAHEISVQCSQGDYEACLFASDVVKALTDAHWKVPNVSQSMCLSTDTQVFYSGTSRPADVQLLENALKRCGDPYMEQANAKVPCATGNAFIIGRKPE